MIWGRGPSAFFESQLLLLLSRGFNKSHFKFGIFLQATTLVFMIFLLARLARQKMSIKIGMKFPIVT